VRLFGFDGVILEGGVAGLGIWSITGRRTGLVGTGTFPGRILIFINGCDCQL
jgi:hypothetical protein